MEHLNEASPPLISAKLVLIHEKHRNSALTLRILQHLSPATLVRYSPTSFTDIMLALHVGSIGFSLQKDYNSKAILQSLILTQKSFWRSFAIFQNISQENWQQLQCALPGSKFCNI